MRNLINADRATLEAATGLPKPRRHTTSTEREYITRQRREAARRRDLARRVARAMKASQS